MAYTKQPIRLARFQIDPGYDAAGAINAAKVNSFIQAKRLQSDTDANDATEAPWVQVNFDLLDPTIENLAITASGKTVTYRELAALIRKACLDRAQAQGVQ